jgi:cell division protein ZapA
MGEVALKIVIGNREYPMKVQEETVAVIEEISKSLNESIENHKKTLGLSDVQDAMAMTAFDCMVKLYSSNNATTLDAGTLDLIATLNQKIEKALS